MASSQGFFAVLFVALLFCVLREKQKEKCSTERTRPPLQLHSKPGYDNDYDQPNTATSVIILAIQACLNDYKKE